MRIVTLSDHAAEQIQKAQDARAEVNDRLTADWQAAVDRRQAAIAGHAAALRQAWAQRRVLAVAGRLFAWLGAQLSRRPDLPQLLTAGAEEGRFQGGQEGEARVLAALSGLFDDRWVAFKGYSNRGGETDLLLLGPTAIAALEVKYRNGVVHCEGSHWTCDKSDKYGNVVERGQPVRDAKGRSPGQQVNATADGLQAQLARRGFPVRVRRAVILSHDASRLGRVSDPGVEFIGVLAERAFGASFLAFVQPPPGQARLQVAALEQLIWQDHQYHAQVKAQRASPHPMVEADSTAPIMPAPAASAPSPVQSPATQALARPRPIKLMPPSADAQRPPTDLERRQAQALRADIIALHRSQGRDAALERRVRRAISGHLQTGDRGSAFALAVPVLEHKDGRLLLQRLIQECRQTVELEDRTLHAIVVPLAVRWEAPEGADWSGVRINAVGGGGLEVPALYVRQALGAGKVVFGSRLYDGGRLESIDARLLRQAMMQIEAGEDPEIPERKPAGIAPSRSADWQIVYLLAVVVTEPGALLRLDDEARRELAGRTETIADAFTLAALEATGDPRAAQAHAEGVWTLADGVQHGRRLQQRHVLETVLAAGAGRGSRARLPLRCWFAQDRGGLHFYFLVDWGSVRAEREFIMHGEEQPLDAFRGLLDAAIAARVPAGTSIQVEELDLHDYRKQVQALGMSWIGQGPEPAGKG